MRKWMNRVVNTKVYRYRGKFNQVKSLFSLSLQFQSSMVRLI